jgi:RNA polymerase sigma-70 factor (ECF subfamily)
VTEDEIRTVYRATIDELYGYVSRRCGGDRALAEDVTQEAWLCAVVEWRSKGMPRRPIAWLTTVARNLLLESADVLVTMDDGRVAESSDVARAVNHALRQLPLREAQLLEAFHFDGCRVAQLAAALGISERAVEGRLRRARRRLRRELEAMFAKQERTA